MSIQGTVSTASACQRETVVFAPALVVVSNSGCLMGLPQLQPLLNGIRMVSASPVPLTPANVIRKDRKSR